MRLLDTLENRSPHSPYPNLTGRLRISNFFALILLTTCVSTLDEAWYQLSWTDFSLQPNQSQTLNLEKFTNVRYAHEFNGHMQYNFTLTVTPGDLQTNMSFVNIFSFNGSMSDKAQYLRYKQAQLPPDQVAELNKLLCVEYAKQGKRIPVVDGVVSLSEQIPISKFVNGSAVNVIDSSPLCLEANSDNLVLPVMYSIQASVRLTNLDNEYVTVFYGKPFVICSIFGNHFFFHTTDLPQHLCLQHHQKPRGDGQEKHRHG